MTATVSANTGLAATALESGGPPCEPGSTAQGRAQYDFRAVANLRGDSDEIWTLCNGRLGLVTRTAVRLAWLATRLQPWNGESDWSKSTRLFEHAGNVCPALCGMTHCAAAAANSKHSTSPNIDCGALRTEGTFQLRSDLHGRRMSCPHRLETQPAIYYLISVAEIWSGIPCA